MTTETQDAPEMQWVVNAKDYPRDTLRVQLEVYEESILLRGFTARAAYVKPVSADEIARVFIEHLGFSSGLLPRDVLWWGQGETGQIVGLWRKPRVWSVALQREPFKPPERLRLPMPGLVFVCSPRRAPFVYAAKTRPTTKGDELYRMPTFNVFDDGRVCSGSHNFPEDVGEIPESFFASYFSLTGDSNGRSKKYPQDLLRLWEELNGEDEYPEGDLRIHGTVESVMEATGGRRYGPA